MQTVHCMLDVKSRVRAFQSHSLHFCIDLVRKEPSLINAFLYLKEHELDRYITFCDGKGDSDSFLESQPKDFFEVGLEVLQ